MKNVVILSLFISLIVLVMSISVYFYYITPLSEYSYPTTAFVTQDVAGFDINTTAITFGSIVPGGTSTRSIVVNNSYSFPIKVQPEIEGSIEQIISYKPLVVGPNQSLKLEFTIYAESIEFLGNYTGNISIKLMRA